MPHLKDFLSLFFVVLEILFLCGDQSQDTWTYQNNFCQKFQNYLKNPFHNEGPLLWQARPFPLILLGQLLSQRTYQNLILQRLLCEDIGAWTCSQINKEAPFVLSIHCFRRCWRDFYKYHPCLRQYCQCFLWNRESMNYLA